MRQAWRRQPGSSSWPKLWPAIPERSGFGDEIESSRICVLFHLPPVVLARGLRRKDRFVIAVGAITAILTLVTNKPYLGWQRHTWDPMLLGALLTAVAIFIRRWLARGTGGIRRGFTAGRISGRDKLLTNAGSAVFGLLTPQSITPATQTSGPGVRFGGGRSGGGGASGDF